MTAGLRGRSVRKLLLRRVMSSPAARDLHHLPRRVGSCLARVVYGRRADRAPLLLAAVVVGALLVLLGVLEASWPSDFLGVAR